jgi:hypothetical protein
MVAAWARWLVAGSKSPRHGDWVTVPSVLQLGLCAMRLQPAYSVRRKAVFPTEPSRVSSRHVWKSGAISDSQGPEEQNNE